MGVSLPVSGSSGGVVTVGGAGSNCPLPPKFQSVGKFSSKIRVGKNHDLKKIEKIRFFFI